MSEIPEREKVHTTDDNQEAVVAPNQKMPTTSQLFVALGILLLVFGVSYFKTIPPKEIPQQRVERANSERAEVEKVPATTASFDELDITAASVFVWDVKEQKSLYSKNADDQLPLASLTKLMTALVAENLLNETDTIPIEETAVAQEGESFFRVGDSFSFKNLLDLTLVTSSNDGAFALASAGGATLTDEETAALLFIKEMNAQAEKIGMSSTFFTNPTGLDTDEKVSGSYGSARDVAFLVEHIIKHDPDILSATRESHIALKSHSGLFFDAHNTNESVNQIAGILGSKTGYTELAGGNLVVVFDVGLNHPVIVSVLGSTQEGRFSDVAKISEEVRKLY